MNRAHYLSKRDLLKTSPLFDTAIYNLKKNSSRMKANFLKYFL